jgi:hypothetical protein
MPEIKTRRTNNPSILRYVIRIVDSGLFHTPCLACLTIGAGIHKRKREKAEERASKLGALS